MAAGGVQRPEAQRHDREGAGVNLRQLNPFDRPLGRRGPDEQTEEGQQQQNGSVAASGT